MTSDQVLDALRRAVVGTGIWRLAEPVAGWDGVPDSAKNRSVLIAPGEFTVRVQGACRDVTRSWSIRGAIAIRRQRKADSLLDTTLSEEDLLVDALLALDVVTDLSGSYAEESDGQYQILTLSVTTQTTRPAQQS